ncbi:MAG TPA: hypothetical protein DCG51_12005 [Erysipelotrichaceae bacterium]|nr:hypothetical protein [Erysipelotrichaceae bacterium]
MKRLKVCWISNIPSPYKTAVMNLVGTETDLIALYEKHGESDREDSWYDRSFHSFTGIYLTKRNAKRIIKDQAEQCDCLINSDYSNPYAMYAVECFRRQKKTVFMQADGGLAMPRGPVDFVISQVMKRCDRYISPGSETDKYYAYYHIPQDRISHYRFACMSAEEIRRAGMMREQKEQYRQKLGFSNQHVLLSVGQQIPRKGYDILVQAMNGITEDIGVYIVGGEPEEHVLQYVKDNHLDNIRFIPFLNKEQLAEYYAAADCFVLPTRYDIWGLVINEAMAYGLPVISTDRCVAAVQFNEQCGNALIVPAEDVTSLREAIKELYHDSERSEKLSAASLTGIQDWSLENMKDDLIKILYDHVRTV